MSVVAALERGLSVYQGKPLVNSVTGKEERLETVLPRPTLNVTFLTMAIAVGMTCAITNPLEEEIRKGILAANMMMGHDENCKAWLAAHRSSNDADSERAARPARRKAHQLD